MAFLLRQSISVKRSVPTTYYTYDAYGKVESVREEAPDGNIVRKGDAGEMVYTNPNMIIHVLL